MSHPFAAPAPAAAVLCAPGGWWHGVRYGALGFPLAFVALPLYVMLPNHYATTLGVSLAGLGAVLLAARLLDAVVDPWIGRVCDGWFAHGHQRVLGWGAATWLTEPVQGGQGATQDRLRAAMGMAPVASLGPGVG